MLVVCLRRMVRPQDVVLELSILDAPLSPPSDSDRTELSGPNEGVCLRGADGEDLTYVFQSDEPARQDPGLTRHHLTFLQ